MFKVLAAAWSPKGDPFAGEVDLFFRRQPADGGFGLEEEGAVERVLGFDKYWNENVR